MARLMFMFYYSGYYFIMFYNLFYAHFVQNVFNTPLNILFMFSSSFTVALSKGIFFNTLLHILFMFSSSF